MMRALRDFNLPKIVDDDKPIFKRIIADLFPGFELAAKVDKNFNDWVKKCAVQQRMQPEEGVSAFTVACPTCWFFHQTHWLRCWQASASRWSRSRSCSKFVTPSL